MVIDKRQIIHGANRIYIQRFSGLAVVHFQFEKNVAPAPRRSRCAALTPLHERNAFGHMYDRRSRNLIVPGLTLIIERDPNEANAGGEQRKEPT